MTKYDSRGRPKIVLDRTHFLSCLEKFENATRKNPYTLKDFASDLKVSRSRVVTELKVISEERVSGKKN